MKTYLYDFLRFVGLFIASYVVYIVLILFLTWGLTWSNTIIALFVFMGCPVLLTVAYWCAMLIAMIPIKTKVFFPLAETNFLYFMGCGVYSIWNNFTSFSDGWEIALKVIFTLVFIGVYFVAAIVLYEKSKEQWIDNKFFRRRPKHYARKSQSNKNTDTYDPPKPVVISNSNLYENLFIQKMQHKYPNVANRDELFKRAMEDYDTEHDYAERNRKELQEFAEMVNRCPNIATIYAGWLEHYQNGENPDLALLDIDQRLKDLIAGRITIEEYGL